MASEKSQVIAFRGITPQTNGWDKCVNQDVTFDLAGWELSRIESSFLCNSFALRANYSGEFLHALRGRQEYMAHTEAHKGTLET